MQREVEPVNEHLSDRQITEWILGTSEQSVTRHVQTCPTCSRETEAIRNAISGYRDSVRANASREPSFWISQELAIRERLLARAWRPVHWAWAVAMVLVLVAAIFLTRAPSRERASEVADNALLEEIQGDLSRQIPRALAPAVLIAEERNELLTSHPVHEPPNSHAPAALVSK